MSLLYHIIIIILIIVIILTIVIILIIIIFLKIIINQQNDDFDKHSKGEEAQGRILSLITIERKGRSTSVIDDIFFWPNVTLHHHRCQYCHGRLCPHCCYHLCLSDFSHHYHSHCQFNSPPYVILIVVYQKHNHCHHNCLDSPG